MGKLDEILEQLHEGLARDLLKRVKSGEATASDLNVVRQFLKDNGIDNVPKKGSPFGELVNSIPDDLPDEIAYN